MINNQTKSEELSVDSEQAPAKHEEKVQIEHKADVPTRCKEEEPQEVTEKVPTKHDEVTQEPKEIAIIWESTTVNKDISFRNDAKNACDISHYFDNEINNLILAQLNHSPSNEGLSTTQSNANCLISIPSKNASKESKRRILKAKRKSVQQRLGGVAQPLLQ